MNNLKSINRIIVICVFCISSLAISQDPISSLNSFPLLVVDTPYSQVAPLDKLGVTIWTTDKGDGYSTLLGGDNSLTTYPEVPPGTGVATANEIKELGYTYYESDSATFKGDDIRHWFDPSFYNPAKPVLDGISTQNTTSTYYFDSEGKIVISEYTNLQNIYQSLKSYGKSVVSLSLGGPANNAFGQTGFDESCGDYGAEALAPMITGLSGPSGFQESLTLPTIGPEHPCYKMHLRYLPIPYDGSAKIVISPTPDPRHPKAFEANVMNTNAVLNIVNDPEYIVLGGEEAPNYSMDPVEVEQITAQNYFMALPVVNYNRVTLNHYKSYLKQNYNNNLEALKTAWYGAQAGNAKFNDWESIDPRNDAWTPAAFQEWRDFQEHRNQQYMLAQYNVVRRKTDRPIFYLSFGFSSAYSMVHSSGGAANGDWFGANEPNENEILMPMSEVLEQAKTFGLPQIFPIFGFSWDRFGTCPGEIDSFWNDKDPGWQPHCILKEFADRVSKTFYANNIQEMGLSYHKAPTEWSGYKAPAEKKFRELVDWRNQNRSNSIGMAPWAPELVVTGQTNDLTKALRTVFKKHQIQYGRIANRKFISESSEMPLKRAVIMSANEEDFGDELLEQYLKATNNRGFVLAFTDPYKVIALSLGQYTFGAVLPLGNEAVLIDMGLPQYNSRAYVVAMLDPNDAAFAASVIDQYLVPVLIANYPILKPAYFTATDSQGDLELSVDVMTDGLNVFATIFNASNITRTGTFAVAPVFKARMSGTAVYSDQTISLSPYETKTIYLDANITGVTNQQIETAMTDITTKIAVLENDGYDVSLANKYIAEFSTLKAAQKYNKLLALILKLRKMLYVKFQKLPTPDNNVVLTVSDYNKVGVEGVKIQPSAEMYANYKLTELVTNVSGSVLFSVKTENLTQYATWDFLTEEYKTPANIEDLFRFIIVDENKRVQTLATYDFR